MLTHEARSQPADAHARAHLRAQQDAGAAGAAGAAGVAGEWGWGSLAAQARGARAKKAVAGGGVSRRVQPGIHTHTHTHTHTVYIYWIHI